MNEVTLKNGSVEMDVLVTSVMMNLNALMNELPSALAAYDLVEICRYPSYKPFGNNADILKERGLMQPNGTIHGSIRNIVLSAYVRDGECDFHFESPRSL